LFVSDTSAQGSPTAGTIRWSADSQHFNKLLSPVGHSDLQSNPLENKQFSVLNGALMKAEDSLMRCRFSCRIGTGALSAVKI
jgi:hypothetical protein